MAADSNRPSLHVVSNGRRVDPVAHARALLSAGLDMAFQPIVHLGSGSVIAYEALARPRHADGRNPMTFFSMLGQAGLRLDGERMAFSSAVAATRSGFPRVKLFMNASPLTLVDPDFDILEIAQLIKEAGLPPSGVVVEVTESEAVHDLDELAQRAGRLRRIGVGIAVDDAGAGHASFRVITRLRPSYIKLDRDLVSHIETDGARHAFIESMVRFSRQIGSRLIAEGIETAGELAVLAGLAVEAGQGYFLARPAVGEFPEPSAESRRTIEAAAKRLRLGNARVAAGELARPVAILQASATVREAYDEFAADRSARMMVLASGPDTRVSAQITRRVLERALAQPDAWAALADLPVSEVAEHEPLTVDASLDILAVGGIVAARPEDEVLDDVLVTDPHGELIGVLTVRDLIWRLTEERATGEEDLNPLSGLLGPAWVEAEIKRRVEAGAVPAVTIIDVDGFGRVNEIGGFPLGDDLIRVIGRCLSGVAADFRDAAAAHVGGDDFILMSDPRDCREAVAELVRSFESEVMPFLRTELRLSGGEDGASEVALSMASVEASQDLPAGYRHLEWVNGRLAELMRTAKSHGGYSSVHRGEREVLARVWTPSIGGERTVSLGLAEPSLALGALDLVDEAFAEWWQRSEEEGGGKDRFPGPQELVEHLSSTFLVPLREEAMRAVEERVGVMPVALQGDEDQMLELLDRVALVTARASASRKLPLPPELALLGRLLRQRSRSMSRKDLAVEEVPAG